MIHALHPSIPLLWRLRLRAWRRTTLRAISSVRGALTLTLIVLFAGPLVIGLLLGFIFRSKVDPEPLLRWAPAVMLAATLVSGLGGGGRKIMRFTPAEIDHLMPAPISRAQLIIAKLLEVCAVSGAMGVFLLVFLHVMSASLVAAFLAAVLGAAYMQLLALVLVQAVTTIRRAAGPLMTAVIGAAALGAMTWEFRWAWSPEVTAGLPFLGIVDLVRATVTYRAATAPFLPFILLFTSADVLATVQWTFICLLLMVICGVMLVRMDADALDMIVRANRRSFERKESKLRSGGRQVSAPRGMARVPVPMMPALGGAGGIMRRRLIELVRIHPATLLTPLLVVVAGVIAVRYGLDRIAAAFIVGAAGVAAGPVLIAMVRLDFREDLDHLPGLRMLPISPVILTLGQLAVPVAFASAAQVLLLTTAWYLHGSLDAAFLMLLAFVLPVCLLFAVVENGLFLLYPTRRTGGFMSDVRNFGRSLLTSTIRAAVLGAVAVVAGGTAAAIAFFAGHVAAGLAVGWVLLTAATIALVPVTAWTFHRFDVSRELPA